MKKFGAFRAPGWPDTDSPRKIITKSGVETRSRALGTRFAASFRVRKICHVDYNLSSKIITPGDDRGVPGRFHIFSTSSGKPPGRPPGVLFQYFYYLANSRDLGDLPPVTRAWNPGPPKSPRPKSDHIHHRIPVNSRGAVVDMVKIPMNS